MSEAPFLSFFVTLDPHERSRFFLFLFLPSLSLSARPYPSFFRIFCVFEVLRMHRVSTLVVLLAFVLTQALSLSLSCSHVQLAFTSVFPSHSRGSRRSDLSAVLTADRDRQACNYIVIYACYGAQPAWPVGLQWTPPFPAPHRRVSLSLSRGCGFKCRAAFRRRLILRPCRQLWIGAFYHAEPLFFLSFPSRTRDVISHLQIKLLEQFKIYFRSRKIPVLAYHLMRQLIEIE